MSIDSKNNKQAQHDAIEKQNNPEQTSDKNQKPHIARRNVEDYLEEQALKKRLADIFDDDFILD